MLELLRILGRICFVAIVIALLAGLGWLYWFTQWRSDKLRALEEGSEITDTARGEVEFAMKGEGPCVLILHGTPGGYDQGLLFTYGLEDKGFQIIAPSRPGYLRTPLLSGLLPEEQADLMAALLDVLGIKSTSIIAVNGGAASALCFASRHPERLRSMVLISPVLTGFDYGGKKGLIQPGNEVLERLTGDVGSWIAVRSVKDDPRPFLMSVLKWTSRGDYEVREKVEDAVLADPVQLGWFRDLVDSFAPLSPRETGARNDLNLDRIPTEYDWDRMKAPTLIIEGKENRGTVFSEFEAVASHIPGVKILAVEGAGTLVPLGPWWQTQREEVIGFLRESTQTPVAP